MNKLILILLLLVTSCSTFSRDNWGPWKITSVPLNEKVWKFCRAELHGPVYDRKGHCYIDQECRFRETIFGNEKKECRPKTLFCKWGDVQCLERYNIFFNNIINEGVNR